MKPVEKPKRQPEEEVKKVAEEDTDVVGKFIRTVLEKPPKHRTGQTSTTGIRG